MKDLITFFNNSFISVKRKKSFRSAKGGVLIEVAITLPIFLVLIFMLLEMMLYSYATLTAQYVVSKVMRDYATHRIGLDHLEQEINAGARNFGIIAIGDKLNGLTHGCDANSLRAKRAPKDYSNFYCLTNVSFFTACNNCSGINNDDGNIFERNGDLYSLNWSFTFPMTSWFLIIGNPNNEEFVKGVTISASASARLEPQI